MIKIAFFWTWEFSKNILSSILKDFNWKIDVLLVISQPDKPVWRDKELQETPIKKFSLVNNIEVLQPESLRIKESDTEMSPWRQIIKKLKSLNLDFIVVVAYWKIIPKEILSIPKYGCINIHWSLLPKYRWASPIQESLKNWDKKTGLTIMYMSEWMDEWNILKIEEIDVDIVDKTTDIFNKFENIWANLLVSTLDWILNWKINWIEQDLSIATYCKKIEKKDWEIDFNNETVIQIYNKFRAYYPWPWIYTYYKWKKFDIKDCFFEENEILFDDNFKLWDVVEFDVDWKEKIAIICIWWLLILNKIKLEWKKEMSINDYINGNKDFLDYNFLNN